MRFLKVPPRLVLPFMVFIAVLIVGVRIGDAWTTLHDGSLFASVAPARAEEKPAANSPITTEVPEEKAKESAKEAPKETPKETGAPSALSPQEAQTPEGALYEQLSGRRAQLDKRAKELDAREALIKIAEARVDQKFKEMETLRAQIQTLLGQANASQQAQLENLVKIYEIMKPKEAAKIFETLEMPVLLGVVQRMKPARTAAILGEMDPQKAKDITTALTKQNQLPQVQ